ncbi:MAG: YggT family protein [Thermodesulfobacteriota bacterium]|jgi:YggT family protein|nr:MAG: YggT family protein [Thermodesulfobacteriota bacterium]
MVFLAYFFEALANVVDIGLTIYMWIVVIRAIISWVNPDPYNPIVVFLRRLTDPVLNSIRRRLPFALSQTGIDFSPLILLLGIIFLQKFLVKSLYELAYRLH